MDVGIGNQRLDLKSKQQMISSRENVIVNGDLCNVLCSLCSNYKAWPVDGDRIKKSVLVAEYLFLNVV